MDRLLLCQVVPVESRDELGNCEAEAWKSLRCQKGKNSQSSINRNPHILQPLNSEFCPSAPERMHARARIGDLRHAEFQPFFRPSSQ